jgi:HNH endonuclease/Transcriptional regulator, AbiEi antitoxin
MSHHTGSREDNPNWRGGRLVASNGYVLVRVGTDHHLADIRGYAYEHRLVAEQKLGRRLEPGEQVHHDNKDKTDNRPENLAVTGSLAEHFVLHRTKDAGLRMPGETNPVIACECGCGTALEKYDASGRPRSFVTGHNRNAPAEQRARDILAKGETGIGEFAAASGASVGSAKTLLSRLVRRGVVERAGRGIYRLRSTNGR